MSVATHPDFQGHADDAVAEQADKLVHPPLTGTEIRVYVAVPPAKCRDALAQLQEDGLPTEESS